MSQSAQLHSIGSKSSMQADVSLKENDLQAYLQQGYAAYTYAYPHKSAYRALENPVPLDALWQSEARDDLFLYLHVPFCHYRCGFCNLFALGAPKAELVDGYLLGLQRQIKVTARALSAHRLTRMAIGGGTPSYLSVAQFEWLMDHLRQNFQLDATNIAIEVAPESADVQRLRSYKAAGVTRISMGVQSFIDHEMDALARPRQRDAVLAAVDAVRSLDFAQLNLDLIYGIEGQTDRSFLSSLTSVLSLQPDELYLYPLYVRRLTGLAKADRTRGLQQRAQLYQIGVECLRAAGYEQCSTRMFRKRESGVLSKASDTAPEFACQSIGTVGLGPGARSYTRALHYSEEYAVSRSASSAIVQAYNARGEAEFATARYGFVLDDEEQKRRFLLQSLLIWPGVDLAEFRSRFGSDLSTDFPQLQSLLALDLAVLTVSKLSLTDAGMAQADAIGPWLYSDSVRHQMQDYDWR